jgi:hypothetical protein
MAAPTDYADCSSRSQRRGWGIWVNFEKAIANGAKIRKNSLEKKWGRPPHLFGRRSTGSSNLVTCFGVDRMTTPYDSPPDEPAPPKKKKQLTDSLADIGWLPGSVPQPSNADLELPPLPEMDPDNSMLNWVNVVDEHVRRKSSEQGIVPDADYDIPEVPDPLADARQEALQAARRRSSHAEDVFGGPVPLAEGASGVNFADALPPLAESVSGINLDALPPLAEGVSLTNLTDASIPLASGVSHASLSDFFADLPEGGVPVAEGVSGVNLGGMPPLAESVSGSHIPLGKLPVPLGEGVSGSSARLNAQMFNIPEAVPLSGFHEISEPLTSAPLIDLPEASFLPDDVAVPEATFSAEEMGLPPEPTFTAEMSDLPPEPAFTAEMADLPPEPTFTAEVADLPPEPAFAADSTHPLPEADAEADWGHGLPIDDGNLVAQPVSFAPSSLDLPVVAAWAEPDLEPPQLPPDEPTFDSLLLPDETPGEVRLEPGSMDDLLLPEETPAMPSKPGSTPDLFLDPEEQQLGEDEVPLLSGEIRPPSVEMDAPFFPEDPGNQQPTLADSFSGDESAWSPPKQRNLEDELFGPASDDASHEPTQRRGIPTQAMVDLDTLEGNLWAPDLPVEGDGALDLPPPPMFAPPGAPTQRTAEPTANVAFDPLERPNSAEDSDSALSQQLFGNDELEAAGDHMFGPAHGEEPRRVSDTFDPLKPGSLAEIDMASLLNNPGAARTQHDMGTDWHQPSGVVGEQSSAIDLNDMSVATSSVPQSGLITASGSLPRPSSVFNPQEGSEVDLGSQPHPALQPDMADDDDLEPLPKPPPRTSGQRTAVVTAPPSGLRPALPTSGLTPAPSMAPPAPARSGWLAWLASGAIGLFVGMIALAGLLYANVVPQIGAMLGLARINAPVRTDGPRNTARDARELPPIPGREDKLKAGLQLLRDGKLDDAVAALAHLDATNAEVLLAQAQATWLSYVRDQHAKGAKVEATSEAFLKTNKLLTGNVLATDPRALLWRGLISEDLGMWRNAGQLYGNGAKNFPTHKQMFETAQHRIQWKEMTWQFLGEQPPLNPGEAPQSWLQPAPWGNLWMGVILLQMTNPPTEEFEEPGHAYYHALKLASENKYDEAATAMDKAIAAHRNRQIKQPKQGLNPVSDPREDIFVQSCYRIKLLWTLEKRLMSSPGKSEMTGKKRNPLDALEVALKAGGMPTDEGKLKDVIAKLTDAKIDAADPVKAITDLIATNKDYVTKLTDTEKDKLALVKEKETLDEKLKTAAEDVKKADAKLKDMEDKLKDTTAKLTEADAKLKLGAAKDEALAAITKSLQEAKLVEADAKPEPAALAKVVGTAVANAGANEMIAKLSKAEAELAKVKNDLKRSEAIAKELEAKLAEAGSAALEAVTKALKDAKAIPADAKPDAAALAKAVASLATAGGDPKEMTAKLTALQTDLTKAQNALKVADDKAKLAEDKAEAEVTKTKQAMTLAEKATKDATEKVDAVRKLLADANARLEATQAALIKATGRPTPVVKIDPTPVAPPPAPPSDAEVAEERYNSGVSKFHSRSYAEAEADLKKAIALNRDDARYHYYLGLAKYNQGRSSEAADDFRSGAALERQSKPGTKSVSSSLERIQGSARQLLNSYRP